MSDEHYSCSECLLNSLNNFEVLIADEPTSELDVFEARRLIALFVEMNRLGTAIVVATHSEDLPARHPARVITLAEGRVIDAP